MPEGEYLKSLYAALARETDEQAREQLLFALDRFIDNQMKRERIVPDMERR
jgi:hypothetical protein